MKRLLVAAAFLGGLAVRAAAQTATIPAMPANTVLFVAVDSLRVEDTKLYVTGIVQGEATPSERVFYFTSYSAASDVTWSLRASCERLALVAMSKPGQYTFELAAASGYTNPKCRLARVSP